MDLPEYITKEEVRRVCKALGIRDWTKLTSPKITLEEAKVIQQEVGGETLDLVSEEFQLGLEVELEHGLQFPDANVTNNHPLLTGKIVLAHLKEMLDYYLRLEVAELEGDLWLAAAAGDAARVAREYKKLATARAVLHQRESDGLAKA